MSKQMEVHGGHCLDERISSHLGGFLVVVITTHAIARIQAVGRL